MSIEYGFCFLIACKFLEIMTAFKISLQYKMAIIGKIIYVLLYFLSMQSIAFQWENFDLVWSHMDLYSNYFK